MGELDSLHIIFLITTNRNLSLATFKKKKKKKQKLKNQQIFEQKLFSLVKNISSNLKSSNFKIHKSKQNNLKSKFKKLN